MAVKNILKYLSRNKDTFLIYGFCKVELDVKGLHCKRVTLVRVSKPIEMILGHDRVCLHYEWKSYLLGEIGARRGYIVHYIINNKNTSPTQ